MKAYKHFPALAALCILGVMLMAASCAKVSPASSDDLQFAAESSIATKAIYGADTGDYQRIIWQSGDEVTIASDQAQTLWGRKFCDYSVEPVNNDATAQTRQSQGKIKRISVIVDGVEDSGLRWNENASGVGNFWSVYPATTNNSIQNGNVRISIPSATSTDLSVNQPSGNIVTILDPRKGSYPMVAHASSNANTGLVKLQYYPAFTAFQVTLFNNSGGEITLSSCSMTSTTVDLYGTFTASIDDLAKDDPDSPVLSDLAGAGKSVSVGIGQVLADGKGVTFNIFCLPQDLTDLTFSCTYVDASGEQTRKLQLKKDDVAITFGACKQHRMTLTLRDDLNFDISLVMKIILANAFNQYEMNWQTGHLELCYTGTATPVPEDEIRAAILQVTDVTITNDYGQQNLPYTAEDIAVFKNLETFVIDHTTTVSSISIDGLPKFTTFDMIYADNIHDVSITNCPMTETVNINSQSLNSLYFENLAELKYLTINEGTANSNLTSLIIKDCPDLEGADLGNVGALKTIDFSGCSKLITLNIGLAYALENLDLSGCSALKTLDINEPEKLKILNTDECTSIESIILRNPQSLLEFESHSTTLKELKFIGGQYADIGAQNLVRLELDTPALTTFHFINMSKVNSLTLANLSASITNFGRFLPPPQYGNLNYLSITACNGFQTVEVDPSYNLREMHFDSCANLRTVSLVSNYASSLIATKHDCPNLEYYTRNGSIRYFTEQ